MRRLLCALVVPFLPIVSAVPTHAQDGNIRFTIPTVERLLRDESFNVLDVRGSRAEGDRTQRMTLQFGEDTIVIVKFAKSAVGGGEFNNEPRYELAAYELQKLFLSESEYVVPPTIARVFPLDWVRRYDDRASATFRNTNSVLVVMQYWLSSVTSEDFWDNKRFDADTMYARYMANMNLLTHLINHVDANVGNFLISTTPVPRVFSVDNGVAFRSERSDRGTMWRNLRVEGLPRATVERLRAITEEDLQRVLGVLVQYEVHNGLLQPVEPTAPLSDSRGVRVEDTVIQLGLTRREIQDVHNRLTRLLQRVDEGKLRVF